MTIKKERRRMKKRGRRILAALTAVLLLAESVSGTGIIADYPGTIYAETQRSAIVNATTLNVRSGPGTGNSVVRKLSYGAPVTVVGQETASDGVLWYKLQFTAGGKSMEGYASSEYIKFPVSYTTDPQFEAYMTSQGFPESYKESLRVLHAEFPSWVFQVQNTGLDWNDAVNNESIVGANLVSTNSLSSWKSTEYGAYDWNTGKWTGFDGPSWVAASRDIVSYYMDPRNFLNEIYVFQFLLQSYDGAHQTREGLQSLVSGTFLEKSTGQGDGNPPSAQEGQNNQQDSGQNGSDGGGTPLPPGQNYGPGMDMGSSGNISQNAPSGDTAQSSPQGVGGQKPDVSLEGPSAVVSARETQVLALPNVEYGPGMDASVITGDSTGASETSPVPSGQSYVDIIMNAGAQSGVNPYVLGAMILQEQANGTSGSISGTTAGYQGIYNFFNIGAYQMDSMSAVTRGLWYASQAGNYGRPWNSIEKSILGGALYYGENFVSQGQDTFYLKKFNVQGSNLYKHQYMTNVEGAAGEGAKLSRAYTDAMKKEPLVFKIPVFNNMPEAACPKPETTGSPNNKLASLEVEGYSLTPTFNKDTESYDVIVNPSVGQISVKAGTIDSKASVSGTGTISLQSGNNTISIEVKAENGSVRTYRLNVVRQSDAPVANVPSGGENAQSSGGNTSGPGSTGNVVIIRPSGQGNSPESQSADVVIGVSPS
ncbi:SH3 domain-containing protein [Clostridium sp. MCC334]|nr:SH3 domain-containing protein [Clostridium sp. MCC334]